MGEIDLKKIKPFPLLHKTVKVNNNGFHDTCIQILIGVHNKYFLLA